MRVSRAVCRLACVTIASWTLSSQFVARADESSPALAKDTDLVDPDYIVMEREIRYREGGSQSWRLDLAARKDVTSAPRPGIVIFHGGGWIEGDKSSFSTRKHGVPGNIVDWADLGYVAVTINYRLAGEATFPAALEDCKCAVRWLRAHAQRYHLDPNRIGAIGNSAGGHLALLLGMVGEDRGYEGDGPYQEESSQVQAVSSDSGPIDLVHQYEQGALRRAVEPFLGGPPEPDRAALYDLASPPHYISATAAVPPMLLIYGVRDEQVPIATADSFVLALGQAGQADVSYHRLAHVGHCPHSLAREASLQPIVREFFARTLRHSDAAQPSGTQ